MKPTYEELERKVERLEELLKLALEKQLNRNSKNSSPPLARSEKKHSRY